MDRNPRLSAPAAAAGAALCLLVPFLWKPFHVDDAFWLAVASRISAAPLAPYDFAFNWSGIPLPIWRTNLHPPLHGYLVAAARALLGETELGLHLAMLPRAVFAAFCAGAAARRLSKSPALAALLSVAAPAFVVGATNAMHDLTHYAFWIAAVAAGVESAQTAPARRNAWAAAAGVCAAAASLTTYLGLALTPLLAAYWFAKRRRWTTETLWLLLPLAAVWLWGRYSLAHAGFFHPFAAGGYAAPPGAGLAPKLPVAAAFFGGAMIWPLACLPLLWFAPRKAAAIAGAVFALLWLWIGARGGPLWAVLAAAGCAAATLAVLGAREPREEFPEVLFCALWLGGIAVYAVGLNWSINARSLLPASLPLALLTLRWTESLPPRDERFAKKLLAAGAALAAACSLWLCAADQGIARAQRDAAEREGASRVARGERVRFVGHWGFQTYMELAGATAYDYSKPELAPGETVVVSLNNSGARPLPVPTRRESITPIPNPWGIATMSPEDGKAGFYSSLFGATPFALGPGQLFDVIVVEKAR